MVFDRVFPSLIEALADASGRLTKSREAALTLLYRLLFLLYAEDRGLLPVNDPRYDDYGLRKRVRDDVARRMEQGDAFSGAASTYYDHLMTLCRLGEGPRITAEVDDGSRQLLQGQICDTPAGEIPRPRSRPRPKGDDRKVAGMKPAAPGRPGQG